MKKMVEYGNKMREVFESEDEVSAEAPRSRAQWARAIATAIRHEGMARSKEVVQASGEAVPPQAEKFLYDTLAVPDLAAIEASFDRSRLLLERGSDVAAMAIDAADSIQAKNSLEKMLAHQLAAAHKVAMEMIGSVVAHSRDVAIQNKRLNAAARCMTAYQQGLLTLRKMRQSGNQRILVQYVNVSDGGRQLLEM